MTRNIDTNTAVMTIAASCNELIWLVSVIVSFVSLFGEMECLMAGMMYSVRYSEYMVTDWATGSCRKLLASTHGKRLRLCLSLSFADLLHSVRTSSSFSDLVDTAGRSTRQLHAAYTRMWPYQKRGNKVNSPLIGHVIRYSRLRQQESDASSKSTVPGTLVRPPSISISGFPSSFHPVPQRSLWIDDNQTLTFAFVCVASNRTHNLESSQFHLRHWTAVIRNTSI